MQLPSLLVPSGTGGASTGHGGGFNGGAATGHGGGLKTSSMRLGENIEGDGAGRRIVEISREYGSSKRWEGDGMGMGMVMEMDLEKEMGYDIPSGPSRRALAFGVQLYAFMDDHEALSSSVPS